MNPNEYRKALFAGLSAGLVYAQASQPKTSADWGQVAAAAISAALVTYFIPNSDKTPKSAITPDERIDNAVPPGS
jgi:uncharacterized membrane protein (UPF0136 family)